MDFKVYFKDKILENERILLRKIRGRDIIDFHDLAKVKGVGEMAGWKHHKNIIQSQLILLDIIRQNETLALVLKDNKKMVGIISLEEDEELIGYYPLGDVYNLGFVMNKKYWRRGIMVDALRLLLDNIFKIDDVNYLSCSHMYGNYPSKKLIEKLGFIYKKNDTVDTDMGTKELVCVYEFARSQVI